MQKAFASWLVGGWVERKSLAPRKKSRGKSPCTPCALISTMVWRKRTPPLVSSASKSGFIKAMFCRPNGVNHPRPRKKQLQPLPLMSVVKAASAGAIVARSVANVVIALHAVIVQHVRREIAASVRPAPIVHRESAGSAPRVVIAHRESVLLALIVHVESGRLVHKASGHRVRRGSAQRDHPALRSPSR